MLKVFLLVINLCWFVNFVQAASRPNIVFILADDMNRDTWGVYGGKDCKTPNIDQLASEGLTFDRAYGVVAMCAPFRQELYSGRTAWRAGTLANHSKSKPGTKSIPHYLQPLGYEVALLGKSHVGPSECYPFTNLKTSKEFNNDNDKFVDAASKFFDTCTEEKKPFCLFIASHDSHAPFTSGDPTAYDASKLTIPPYWIDTPVLRETLTKYYAEITNFDALVGRVRKELEQKNLWQNTIFMVCGEQGTQLPFAKWTCYDNGLRTGFVAHWSGVTKPGSVCEELISMADVTPTLVDAVGGSLQPGDCDGKSFLKMLKGEPQVINDYVIGAFTNCNIIGNRDRVFPIRVIRNKSFSLIYNPNYKNITSNVTLSGALNILDQVKTPKEIDTAASWVQLSNKSEREKTLIHKLHHRPEFELYHLTQDPYELKNEIDNPEYAKIVEKLKGQLFSRLKELGDANPIETESALVNHKTEAELLEKKEKKKLKKAKAK